MSASQAQRRAPLPRQHEIQARQHRGKPGTARLVFQHQVALQKISHAVEGGGRKQDARKFAFRAAVAEHRRDRKNGEEERGESKGGSKLPARVKLRIPAEVERRGSTKAEKEQARPAA